MNKDTIVSVDEIKLYRHTHRLMRQLRAFGCDENSDIAELISKYDEYIEKNPCSPLSWEGVENDFFRKDIILRAEIIASKEYDNLLKTIGEGEFRIMRAFDYIAVNPHNFEVDAVLYFPTDFWEIGKVSLGNCYLKDNKGKTISTQRIDTIRGSFLIAKIQFGAKEKQSFSIVAKSLVNPKFICKCIFKLKNIVFYKPNKREKEIMESIDILRVVGVDGKGTRKYAISSAPKMQYVGEIAKKYLVSYNLDCKSIKYINAYFTFFKGSNRVDMSIDIVKDNCADYERMYLQFKGGNNLLSSEKKLKNGESCPLDKYLIYSRKQCVRVISVFDNSKIVNIDNIASIMLLNNYNNDKIMPNNSCLLESRFVIEDCETDDADRVAATHDIEIITVRS